MGVRDIFSHGNKLSQKKFGKLYSKDVRMGEVFGNKKISKTLDKAGEKHEFYDLLKKKKEGGVTKQEMKEVFGDLMAGKGRTISRKEAYAVAKEFFGDEKVRYIMPKEKGKAPASAGRASSFGSARKAIQNIQKDFGPFGGAGKSVKGGSSIFQKGKTSASSAQTISSSPRVTRDGQSKKIRSISAGMAAIIDMQGPVKRSDSKETKNDFFRAINATRRNIRG